MAPAARLTPSSGFRRVFALTAAWYVDCCLEVRYLGTTLGHGEIAMFKRLLLQWSRIMRLVLLATLIGCETTSPDECLESCDRLQALCHGSLMLLAPCSDQCPLPDETMQCLNRAQSCDAAIGCTATPSASRHR